MKFSRKETKKIMYMQETEKEKEERQKKEREEQERKEKEERERQEQVERAKKEQRKNEIRNEIGIKNSEITNLTNSRSAYEQMQRKINEALPKLSSAASSTINAQTRLQKAYTSKQINQYTKKLLVSKQSIDDVIAKLKDPILTQISKKIILLNAEINARQSGINRLQNEFNSL